MANLINTRKRGNWHKNYVDKFLNISFRVQNSQMLEQEEKITRNHKGDIYFYTFSNCFYHLLMRAAGCEYVCNFFSFYFRVAGVLMAFDF